MKATGLLFDGQRIQIPGLTIVGPGDDPSAMMDSGDYMQRHEWIRQIVVHTTKGIWPKTGELIIPGAGSGGFGKSTADYWSKSAEGKATHGGAPLVVDDDGTVWCLVDLKRIAAYHATTANPWSIGIEMYQRGDGGVREATINATVKLCQALCDLCGIAFQIPSRKYNNDAINRYKFNGGPDMVGVFGHRDVAWDFVHKTSSRGRGDPGEVIYEALAAAGAERFDYEKREDLNVWEARQNVLNLRGSHLKIDGIAGPGTMHAVHAAGFARGADIVLAEKLG